MHKISRRGFIKGVVAGLLSFVAAGRGLFEDIPTALAVDKCDYVTCEGTTSFRCVVSGQTRWLERYYKCFSQFDNSFCYGWWRRVGTCG